MDLNVQLTSAQSLPTTEEFSVMCNVPYHEAVGSRELHRFSNLHGSQVWVEMGTGTAMDFPIHKL